MTKEETRTVIFRFRGPDFTEEYRDLQIPKIRSVNEDDIKSCLPFYWGPTSVEIYELQEAYTITTHRTVELIK